MAAIYGETVVYSYKDEGGIALMASDIPEGAIVGGSDDPASGSHQSYNRIFWWINYDGTSYSGGITGYSWFSEGVRDPYGNFLYGPFYGKTASEIYKEASTYYNLTETFDAWNQNHQNEIAAFITYLQNESETEGCVQVGTAG